MRDDRFVQKGGLWKETRQLSCGDNRQKPHFRDEKINVRDKRGTCFCLRITAESTEGRG